MRGVELPFQLMVSALALVMVLALSYIVLNNAMREDCGRKWAAELEKISSAISAVVHGSAPTQVVVSFDFRCGDVHKVELSLVSTDKATLCQRVCGASSPEGCSFLKFTAYDRKGDTLDVETSCIEGVSDYVPLYGSCPTGDYESIDLERGWIPKRPFGTLLIRRTLESGEPIAVCGRR